ncbi:MAG: hypothetical protein ACYTGZ_03645 [Planctomycetota bacterium]|jgi:hypothetical protein
MTKRALTLSLLISGAISTAAFADSKTPPKGPPWQRDLLAAQKAALEQGKPIFFYFTKTY